MRFVIKLGGATLDNAETLRGTFLVGGGGLPRSAAMGIERRGAGEMRRGFSEPDEAAVVEVRVDLRDGAARIFSGRGVAHARRAGRGARAGVDSWRR